MTETPLSQKLLATSAAYGGGQPANGGGGSVDDLLAQVLGEAGIDPANPASAQADVSNPLTYAALSISQRVSLLPKWARDLKVLGLGKEAEAPEMFVYMRDRRQPGKPGTPENPTQFDTPQGLRSGNDAAAPTGPTTTSQAQTITRALNQPYLWDEEELDEAMKAMQDAGLDVKSFDDVNAVWQGLVERAAKTYTLSEGEKKVTPWDVLELVKREDEVANGGEDPDNFTHVSTSKTVQDISEGEAWSVLQSNLSRMLGRDPSDQEVRDFTHRMGQLAARNPAISKTISTYKDGRLTNSKTTEVDSGFTAEDMMKKSYDEAQADPEYGAFQAASTYFNAAVGALGAIGDV
jgi:hypothetical protein